VPNDKSHVDNRLLRIELAARANKKRRPKDLQKTKVKLASFYVGWRVGCDSTEDGDVSRSISFFSVSTLLQLISRVNAIRLSKLY